MTVLTISKLFFLLLMMSFSAQASRIDVKLGNTIVGIQVLKNGGGNNYIHLHSNETTALSAARSVLRSCGGTLLSLKHRGGRNIAFTLNKKRYVFDPNRIFTSNGIRRTLSRYSRYDRQAAREIQHFATKIRQLIPGNGKVVAVHNNSNYSMKNYYKGGSMQGDASKVYKAPKQYYRNFFFVTSSANFNRFKKLGFNVVLQNNRSVTDDGSLSVAMRHRNYINAEAGYGQMAAQIRMLKATCR